MATQIPAIQAYLNEKDSAANAQVFASIVLQGDAVVLTDKLALQVKLSGNAPVTGADFGKYFLSWFKAHKGEIVPQVIMHAATVLNAANALANDEAAAVGLQPVTGILPKPFIMSSLTALAQIGQLFTYQITAAQMSAMFTTTTKNYGAAGLPTGITIDPNTGAIAGTPTDPSEVSGSPISVTISAENDSGITTADLVLSLLPMAPAVTSPTSSQVLNGTNGAPFSFTPTASNLTFASGITWLLIAAPDSLPAGLSFNPTTGEISGTPTGASNTSHTLKVTTNGGVSSTIPFSILIV
jgi:hypothetical protein